MQRDFLVVQAQETNRVFHVSDGHSDIKTAAKMYSNKTVGLLIFICNMHHLVNVIYKTLHSILWFTKPPKM